ncbi:MAG: ABC transporter ATP-binding protein [Dehalococcoidia bacterium]
MNATVATPRPEALSTSRPVIHLDAVTKRFGAFDALRGVGLEVPRGQVFGLVGPSGCGKTTLVRVVVGLSVPTEGSATVLGQAPHDLSPDDRRRIGYAPQEFFLDPALTVKENCNFVASLYGLGWRTRRRRTTELLETLQLAEAHDRLARSLSGGMRRRLLLACALLHEPELLVVDEPTSGLDPLLRREVWDHLRGLSDRGVSILLTTQYLDEADSCDRVAVMEQGRTIASGTPVELRAQARHADILVFEVEQFPREDVGLLWRLDGVRNATATDGEVRVAVDDGAEATAFLTRWFSDHGATVLAVRTQLPTFDEVFIELVRSAEVDSLD